MKDQILDSQCWIISDPQDVGIRLDNFVTAMLEGATRSHVKRLIEDGFVTINSVVANKSGYITKLADSIIVTDRVAIELSLEPCLTPIDIIYEDEHLAVINKAQGMVVHPATGSPDGTLVNCLIHSLSSLSSINGVIRPGIVHRLDKDTSGLIVVAKTDQSHISLQSQIGEKLAVRKYKALVDGVIIKDEGDIIINIDRSVRDRRLMAVTNSGGRYAETHYNVIERYRGYCLVEYQLKTGRTHQIRVHSKHIGHTIVGDIAYGGSQKLHSGGQLLHAYQLSFDHPVTLERMDFFAPLPSYFEDILLQLRGKV